MENFDQSITRILAYLEDATDPDTNTELPKVAFDYQPGGWTRRYVLLSLLLGPQTREEIQEAIFLLSQQEIKVRSPRIVLGSLLADGYIDKPSDEPPTYALTEKGKQELVEDVQRIRQFLSFFPE